LVGARRLAFREPAAGRGLVASFFASALLFVGAVRLPSGEPAAARRGGTSSVVVFLVADFDFTFAVLPAAVFFMRARGGVPRALDAAAMCCRPFSIF